MRTLDRGGIEEWVLERVRPTELQLKLLSRLYSLVRKPLERCEALKGAGFEWRVSLQGSAAKGTLLSDKWEIDVFLLLDSDKEWINEQGEDLLRSCLAGLPHIVRYSEHPYLTVSLMGMQADVVPARLLIDAREARGVERTPFHTDYVKAKISADKQLADEVRLLKSFLKGIGVYGAETHISGFSGYLAELLTITFGGFREVLKEASRWRPTVYIDPEGVGDESSLRRRYPESPMIVVDPVDPTRNAAAAVSRRSLAAFIAAAKMYLESPSRSFFHVAQRPRRASRSLPGLAVLMRGRFYEYPPEAVWGRLKRIAESLSRSLSAMGFKILYHAYYTDEALRAAVYVGLEAVRLPSIEHLRGPLAWHRAERVVSFKAKRVSEGGWIWVGVEGVIEGARPRRVTSAYEAAQEIVGRLALPPGTEKLEVYECPWPGGACGLPGWVEELRDPTPPWLTGA